MSVDQSSHLQFGDLSPSRLLYIDRLCRQFEQSCRAGESPRIHDYLALIYPNERDLTFRELLGLELDLISERDRLPPREFYEKQFPDSIPLIHAVYLEATQSDLNRKTGLTSSDNIPEVIGDYRLVRKIGQGGMGVVYEAIQESLGRSVALKILPEFHSLSLRRRKRFEREARIVARLHHSHLVEVYGIGRHGGIEYFAMQLIHGQGLDQAIDDCRMAKGKLETNRTLRCRTVARIIRQVASALAYSHEQGVLHRDIKPSNILIDQRGNAWLTDFGLAKAEAIDLKLTHTVDRVGTVPYMAPEAFSGVYDFRSDIYSLGLTLFEAVSLQRAFSNTKQHDIIQEALTGQRAEPTVRVPGVPRDLQYILLKSIAHAPERRYSTAREMLNDLDAYLRGDPVYIARPNPWTRFWTLCRRNPITSGLICSVITMLICCLVLVTGWWQDAKRFAMETKTQQEALLEANETSNLNRTRAIKARMLAMDAEEESKRRLLRTLRLMSISEDQQRNVGRSLAWASQILMGLDSSPSSRKELLQRPTAGIPVDITSLAQAVRIRVAAQLERTPRPLQRYWLPQKDSKTSDTGSPSQVPQIWSRHTLRFLDNQHLGVNVIRYGRPAILDLHTQQWVDVVIPLDSPNSQSFVSADMNWLIAISPGKLTATVTHRLRPSDQFVLQLPEECREALLVSTTDDPQGQFAVLDFSVSNTRSTVAMILDFKERRWFLPHPITVHTNVESQATLGVTEDYLTLLFCKKCFRISRSTREINSIDLSATGNDFWYTLSRDGRYLVSGMGRKLEVWDLPSGQPLKWPHPLQLDQDCSVARFVDGDRRFLAGGFGGRVYAISVSTGQVTEEWDCGTNLIRKIELSPSGKRFFCGSVNEGNWLMGDLESGQTISHILSETEEIASVTWFPDETRIAILSLKGLVTVWDTSCLVTPVRLSLPEKVACSAISISPDNESLAVCYEHMTEIRDLHGRLAPRRLTHTSQVTSCLWNQTGTHLATTGKDEQDRWFTTIWTSQGKLVSQFEFPSSSMRIPRAPEFVPGKTDLIVTDGLEVKRLISEPALESSTVTTFSDDILDWIVGIALSPDGKWIVAATNSGRVAIESMTAAPPPQSPRMTSRHSFIPITGLKAVRSVQFDPHSRWLVLSGYQGLQVWDLATRSILFKNSLVDPEDVIRVRISPSGQLLAWATTKGHVYLVNTQNWKPCGTPFQVTGILSKMMFSHDGHCLLTIPRMGDAIELWDWERGERLNVWRGKSDSTSQCDISSNGRIAAVGRRDGHIDIFRTPAPTDWSPQKIDWLATQLTHRKLHFEDSQARKISEPELVRMLKD